MKISKVVPGPIPGVAVIEFDRFRDERGYFTEHFRQSDFQSTALPEALWTSRFVQCNESFSKKGVIRGLHFQWDPPQGKLVRALRGHLIDLALDLRRSSPTFGKIAAFDLPQKEEDPVGRWVWLPVGIAHGVVFLEDTTIEYFCTGEYGPKGEAGITPDALPHFDWSLCEKALKDTVFGVLNSGPIVSEKDRRALSMEGWLNDPRSKLLV